MRFRDVCLILAVTLVAGCSGSGPSLPEVVPVQGKVLLANGEPLRGGRLIFSPKENNLGGIEPFADVEKDGSFTVTTYQLNDGCIPGQYVVSLTPYLFKSGTAVKLPNVEQIPRRYLSAETSDLLVEITPQNNMLTLRFKSR
jgi:hypothetical protein